MAQKTIEHKGYHGTIEVDIKDFSLHGKILFLDEEITYSGQTFEELDEKFQKAVDRHIQLCRENGKEPPFSEGP